MRLNKVLFDEKTYRVEDLFFLILAGVAIITSVFHFWPFDDNKIWQMLNVPNLCCSIALALMIIFLVAKKGQELVLPYLPHISVIIYLVMNVLSISTADTLSRPLIYTIKLALVFIGGLFLFQRAIAKPKILILFYRLIALVVSLSILICISTRLAIGSTHFGFHGNVFKYGTYIGILVPLTVVYLISSESKIQFTLAILITVAAVFSSGSIGSCLAIFTGLIAALIMLPKTYSKICVLLCILLSFVGLFLSNKVFDNEIFNDFSLKENDGMNLKQRYIEWQAEINLIEKRGIAGTGAGSINDYRSNFYYMLPKLNTLKFFDQNGFLAVGAETGLLGLAVFMWVLIHYSRISITNYFYLKAEQNNNGYSMAAVNTSAFISAMVANLFSSIQYNGILIIFVLLLSLIQSVNKIYGENKHEN